MERSWYWRVALIVGVAIFSLWQLVPSWFYFKLPPDQRNSDAYDKSVPRWAPAARHHLNLGLDLQGGIHLAMGVDVDRAVKAKVARRADEIADYLRSKDVPITEARTVDGGRRIEVKGDDARADPQDRPRRLRPRDVRAGRRAGRARSSSRSRTRSSASSRGRRSSRRRRRSATASTSGASASPTSSGRPTRRSRSSSPGFKDPEKAKELLGRTAQLEFKITDDENPALDALRSTVPQCPGGRAGHRRSRCRRRGCWTAETIELPNGGSRVGDAARREHPRRAREAHPGEGGAAPRPVEERDRDRRGDRPRRPGRVPGALLPDLPAPREDRADRRLHRRRGRRRRQLRPAAAGPPGRDLQDDARRAPRLMEKLTTENMRRRMATVLDDKVETAPYIQGRISSNGQITLGSGHEPPAAVRGGERHRPRAQGRRAARRR